MSSNASQFVLPLGSHFNMNGSALYEGHFFFFFIYYFIFIFLGIAAVYVAQTLGETLSVGKIFIIIITSTISAIGTHGKFFFLFIF
jgi:Na+/H+-dicarboxylate symporter